MAEITIYHTCIFEGCSLIIKSLCFRSWDSQSHTHSHDLSLFTSVEEGKGRVVVSGRAGYTLDVLVMSLSFRFVTTLIYHIISNTSFCLQRQRLANVDDVFVPH